MMIRRLPLLLIGTLGAAMLFAQDGDPDAPAAASGKRIGRAVRITMRDGLRFEPARFEAQPGEAISLRLRNDDTTDMSHNFMLLRPGTREEVVALATALGDQGQARNWRPEHPGILAYSPLIETGRTTTIEFRAPTEPGVYPYVCTFPGHGVMMFGALYVGVKPPPIDADPNLPPSAVQTTLAGGGRRPFAQRVFMPDATPAAIALALVGSQNACWDATECRLRYAWQGTFIDPTPHWQGNGHELPRLSATPWWKAPRGEFPLRFGAAADAPAVKFLGYAMTPAGPKFHYRAGNVEVFEQVLPRREGPGLALHYRIPQPGGAVRYRVAADATVQWSSSAGTWADGVLTLTSAQAADFTVSLTSAACKP